MKHGAAYSLAAMGTLAACGQPVSAAVGLDAKYPDAQYIEIAFERIVSGGVPMIAQMREKTVEEAFLPDDIALTRDGGRDFTASDRDRMIAEQAARSFCHSVGFVWLQQRPAAVFETGDDAPKWVFPESCVQKNWVQP